MEALAAEGGRVGTHADGGGGVVARAAGGAGVTAALDRIGEEERGRGRKVKEKKEKKLKKIKNSGTRVLLGGLEPPRNGCLRKKIWCPCKMKAHFEALLELIFLFGPQKI